MMRLGDWLVRALIAAVVVGLAAFPLLGLSGSVPLGAASFGVVALIASGYDATRAVAWGVAIAALTAAGLLLPDPLGGVIYLAGAALFFAGFLVPAFRRRWFGMEIES